MCTYGHTHRHFEHKKVGGAEEISRNLEICVNILYILYMVMYYIRWSLHCCCCCRGCAPAQNFGAELGALGSMRIVGKRKNQERRRVLQPASRQCSVVAPQPSLYETLKFQITMNLTNAIGGAMGFRERRRCHWVYLGSPRGMKQ